MTKSEPIHSVCVGLLVNSRIDREHLVKFIQSLDYKVIEPGTDEDIRHSFARASLIIVDESAAAIHVTSLLQLKQSVLPVVLPLLILKTGATDAHFWLNQGYDDVVNQPVSKAELLARLNVYARLHLQSKLAVAESEKQLNEIFSLAPSGIARTSIDGKFQLVNRRLCEMLGYEESELLKLYGSNITHHDSYSAMYKARQDLLSGASELITGERQFVRRNGEIFWAEIWAKLARDKEGNPEYYITMFNDITERKRIEQELNRISRAREVMAECNHVLVHAAHESELLRDMCEIVVSMGKYRSAWVGITDLDNPETMRIAACAGIDRDWLLGDATDMPEKICFRRHGPMASTVMNRRQVIINQLLPGSGTGVWSEQARLAGVGSVITFPLVYDGSCYGGVAIHATEMNVFSRDEIELLTELTNDIAYGINSLRTRAIRVATEQSLLESERFAYATIDALRKHISVIDGQGKIIAVNKAWREFGRLDAGFYAGLVLAGDNYLAMCDAAVREGVPEAVEIGRAIRSIARKEQEVYTLEYPGIIDGREHWFQLRISRFPGHGPVRLVISRELITERRLAEDALRRSEERLGFLLSSTPAVIYAASTVRPYGVTFISDNITSQFGYTPGEFLGEEDFWFNLIHPEDQQRVASVLQQVHERTEASIEYRLKYKDGDYRWVRDEAHLVRNSKSARSELVGYMIDIDEKKRSEERLLHMAHFDELTQLPNRVLFHERLNHVMAQCRRNDRSAGVMFIDLDRFKVVNDTLGHTVGDELLRQVSLRLNQCVRADDIVGRLGGDEFAVILSILGKPGDARLVAEKVLSVFTTPYDVDGHEIFVSPSIGITIYPDDAAAPEDLIKNADAAMYRAKEMGRNNYQFYRPEMNSHARQRLELETSLRRALERDEFRLHYQPKVNLHNGEIFGFEALLRWQRPGKGLVPPLEFIPLLEETGLIIQTGEWALRTACTQLQEWNQKGYPPLSISVNLSARQLQHDSLPIMVNNLLRETGIDPGLLELEITESSLMHNTDQAVTLLNILKAKGIMISIDDFGTGYSSLSYLKRLPVNVLKIDRSFVKDVTVDADDDAIVRAIITMAQQLGLDVIAEGVETEQQCRFLAANGCNKAQGYLFGKPMTVVEIEALPGISKSSVQMMGNLQSR